jgi:hypothetical protein
MPLYLDSGKECLFIDEDQSYEFSPTTRMPGESERALWFAVLWKAICDKDVAWLFKDKSDDVGSLSWICEHLFISKGWLRRALVKVYKKNANRFHPIPFTTWPLGYQHVTKDYKLGMIRDAKKQASMQKQLASALKKAGS